MTSSRRRLIALAALRCWRSARRSRRTRRQDFPNRSIRIVVPFPAGGPSDVLARLIGQKMTEDWGQPVVIENRPGANTVIGAQIVAKAPPDGYTLLMAIDSTLTMNQYLYRTPPYDPINDFAPVTLVAKTMQLLMVNAASDVKTVHESGRQGQGAAGQAQLRRRHHLDQAHRPPVQQGGRRADTVLVPYNGSAEVTQGLLTKSVDFTFDGPSAAASLIQSGQFRVLAKFDDRAVPAGAERADGADGACRASIRSRSGSASSRRRARRPPIVAKLQQEIAKTLADPAIKAKADAAGLYPATSTPAEFAAFIKEAERWSTVVAESGMKYD